VDDDGAIDASEENALAMQTKIGRLAWMKAATLLLTIGMACVTYSTGQDRTGQDSTVHPRTLSLSPLFDQTIRAKYFYLFYYI
jgi:hypothetical protein